MTAGASQDRGIAGPVIDLGGNGSGRVAASLEKGTAAIKRFRPGKQWLDQKDVKNCRQNGPPQRNSAMSLAAAKMVSAVVVDSQRLMASVAFFPATIKKLS